MVDYKEQMRERIKQIMNTQYERMYPFEIEKELSDAFKSAQENNEDETKKEILWEIDLLNRAFGHRGIYQEKEVIEISNKWGYLLETNNFKPFVNPPFCEWKSVAIDYYKKRYSETESSLAKARYAFAVMVFSSGQDKLDWMKKSVENWKKCAEKYIQDEKYNKEYYELAPFAYEFALKLSLSFGKKEMAKEVLESLHKNIKTILASGEERWYLEFLEVESKYINLFDNIEQIKKESTDAIKEIVGRLEREFAESKDKNKSNHFIRSHIGILLNYKTENEYELDNNIAKSFLSEAEAREDPLIKSSFYNDAVKKYKTMQSSYADKKDVLQGKMNELILKIKETNSKITYKQFQIEIEITKDQTDKYLNYLKAKKKDLLLSFIDDSSLLPQYDKTKKQTENQKKEFPLQFIIPIAVYNAEEPIMKITSDEDIFDYQVRRNILLGLKIGEIMCRITFESLKKEKDVDILKTIETLITQDELKNMKPSLKTGFDYIFGEKKDFIVGLHIIMPYIEEVLRLIIKKAGKVEVVLNQQKTKFFRGIMLDGLLANKDVEELIGLDFQKSLKVMLVDNDQSNLRNELLHGRLDSNKISEAQTLFVAYFLLKLIKILKEINIKGNMKGERSS